ncbi:hypothetical protein OG535_39580 [Kitasatospora sp. NBC_00085]|uniref:hypothetical protein n=1 Tax=unclassified Kitasatospora TaxID=2633591 RepID=UPI003248C65A
MSIEGTVRAELGVSHAWDSTDLVLPVRAVVDLKGRTAELTDLIADRLTDAHQDAGGAVLPAGTVGGIVAAAVAEVRARPDIPAAELDTGPAPGGFTAEAWRRHVSAGRDPVSQNHATQHRIGVLALEVVPACISDRQAEDILARVADRHRRDPRLPPLRDLRGRPGDGRLVEPQTSHVVKRQAGRVLSAA